VTKIANPAVPLTSSMYCYTKGDTPFSVMTADPELAAGAVQLMP
jgi:hypothetical protein